MLTILRSFTEVFTGNFKEWKKTVTDPDKPLIEKLAKTFLWPVGMAAGTIAGAMNGYRDGKGFLGTLSGVIQGALMGTVHGTNAFLTKENYGLMPVSSPAAQERTQQQPQGQQKRDGSQHKPVSSVHLSASQTNELFHSLSSPVEKVRASPKAAGENLNHHNEHTDEVTSINRVRH